MKPYFILLLFAAGVFGKAGAQNKAVLKCTVQDAQTKEAIASASAFLTDKNINQVMRGTQTDSTGKLIMRDLPAGVFKLEISFGGYEIIVRDSIQISTTAGVLNLGCLQMKRSQNKLLKEVVVTAAGPGNQTGIGKKKFSVEQSLVSRGGTVTDLLQNIPTVTIDGSGNVNLRGSTNVHVLVDGKPSLVGGGDIAQILQSIPAGLVESIEVITNPSAKYDAEGEAGIINIILKKNKKPGFNGSANITAGTRNNYSGGANVSFENSRVNVYAKYDYQRSDIWSNGYQNIQYLDPSNPFVYSNETFPSVTVNKVNNVKAGADYYITPKNLLSFSGGYNISKLNRNESLNISQLDAASAPWQIINSTNLTNGSGNTYNLNLDFIKTFNKPKEELVFSAGYAHGKNNSVQSFVSDIYNIKNPSDEFDTSIMHPAGNNHNSYFNIQADYTLPVGAGSLSIGYRTQIRLDDKGQMVDSFNKITQSYDEYYPYSAYFHGTNQIHALYISYQNQVKGFSYQLGLRGEAANLTGYVNGYDTSNTPLNTPVKVINNRLYPGVTLTQKLEGNQQLQFSYSRRVTRPLPRNYNPIPDISDPVNYDVGNPNILPQDIHAFELGYNKNLHTINFTASFYYRITNDFIAHIESTPVNGVITTTSENLQYSHTKGLEIISRVNAVKSWDFTVNANLFETRTAAAPQYGIAESSGFSWNANITNNFSITKNISLQVRSDYHAPNVSAQDKNYSSFGVDAGGKINLLQGKAALTFAGRDIFATRKWSFLRDGNGVLLDFERKTSGARGSISFTYNFGKDIFKAKKIEHSTEKQDN
jgi:outer membrane receptor protein involved in Fe transport